jgi:hypothetical protein
MRLSAMVVISSIGSSRPKQSPDARGGKLDGSTGGYVRQQFKSLTQFELCCSLE